MTAARRQDRQTAGGGPHGLRPALLLLASALVLAAGAATPVAAQQGWTPTVATAPGTTFAGQAPGAAQMPPVMVDPRFFPPRATAPGVRDPLPQGAWSPIVTGAIPQPGVPYDSLAPRGETARDLEPVEGPTPLRPVSPGRTKTAAAEGAPKKAGSAPPAEGAGSETGDDSGPLFKKPGPLDALPPDANDAQQYCFNTVDTAADARFAWQAKKIQEMEAALEKKSQQLEAKTEEYKRWLERRDTFARKAHEKLVGFYSRMRADAAALQLATLDEETASAVLMKLETKVASQIMGEMDPERAAKIASIISGASKVPAAAKRAAGPADGEPPGPDAAPPPAPPRS